MCSSHGDCAATAGFPHSEIHGSMPAFGYPWHIADRCVLRRLLVPRHSPCTLCSLTCDLSFFTRRKFVDYPFWFFRFTSCFASLSSLFSFQGTLERFLSFGFLNPWWAQVRVTLCLSAYVLLSLSPPSLSALGGLKWIRTTDLALIRRAL